MWDAVMSEAGVPLLALRDLSAGYGDSIVLNELSLDIFPGEIVTLLGRNGVGKTTTLRAIMGIIARHGGEILYRGEPIENAGPERMAHLGIAYCPEERGIFASLNVEENLLLPPVLRPGGLDLAEIYEIFPALKERRASQGTKLSGGEQQMLAIARILRTGANLLLLDEPTEGLAPVIVERIGGVIRSLRERGFTILLVEQNWHFASSLADRHYVIDGGRVVDRYDASEIAANVEALTRHLGV
jgi:branched-chain amino acid transport system ATP-binding protein